MPSTDCSVLVSPLMTRENLCLLTLMRHILFCSTFCMDWVVCRPVRMGSWQYKNINIFSYFFLWSKTMSSKTLFNLFRLVLINLKFCFIMLYYDLFSCDLHILDLWGRSSLCSLCFVEITHVHTTFIFHDSLWNHNGSQH